MKSKFLLVFALFAAASFAFADEVKPSDKPAPEKKEATKESCDDGCCEKDSHAEVKKEAAKPAPADEAKK